MRTDDQKSNRKEGKKGLEVKVNSVEVLGSKSTIEMGYPDTEDEIWFVVNVTYKNTDGDLKQIDFGTISVIHKQIKYVFSRSDLRGELNWEMILDHHEVRTIDLVYKLPFEIQGAIYFEPENNFDGNKIYLGNFNMGKLE